MHNTRNISLLAAAVVAALGLSACAGQGQDKMDKTPAAPAQSSAAMPAAAAPATPAPPAPDAAPSKNAEAAAAAADAAASAPQGPYLHDLLQQPALQKAWQRMGAKAPTWVRQVQGPSSPAQQVQAGGQTYWQSSLCQRHNCPNTFFYLLNEQHAYGVQADFRQPRKAKPVFYGAPPQAERAALQAMFDAELQRQLADLPN